MQLHRKLQTATILKNSGKNKDFRNYTAMLKLKPLRSQKVWGYEDWIASTHPDGCQKEFRELTGNYPLLVKIIQADDTLSVQVHPDDQTARLLEGPEAVGKTECWYVLDSKPGAQLVCGLKKDYTEEEILEAAQDGSLKSMLNTVSVTKGDFIFIPSGTVHAIGGGLRLLEVQQNCNITYRLYDWGRDRELHVKKAAQSVKHEGLRKIEKLPETFDCTYFTLNKKQINGHFSYECSPDKGHSPFELLFVSEGQFRSENQLLKAEEIYALKSGEKTELEGTGEVIIISAKL